MSKKMAIREREVATVSSGAVARVRLPLIHPGKIYCYQRISWEVNVAPAAGNTRCRLVIEGHGYDIPLAEQNAPVADTLYWIHDPNWLYTGERLVLLVDEPDEDTIVNLHGIGYWIEEQEGIV